MVHRHRVTRRTTVLPSVRGVAITEQWRGSKDTNLTADGRTALAQNVYWLPSDSESQQRV